MDRERQSPFGVSNDTDRAALLFDQTFADGQSKSCAAGLGGEERLKDLFEIQLGNPLAVVADCDLNRIARRCGGCEPDRPPVMDGVDGVEQEIENHLLQLFGVEPAAAEPKDYPELALAQLAVKVGPK